MMNNEKEKDAIDTSKLDEILPKYDPLKLNSINLAQNYVSAFNTGMNIYQCVNQLQGYIEWVVKAVNDVVKSWNVQVGESIEQSKAIVRETTTEQFNVEWTNKQPELIEQVNTLTTNQFNKDWGVLENRINTTLETQNTNIQNIQNEQKELETNTNNNINAQNTKINSIQTQQNNLANQQTNLAIEQTTLSNRMDTFTSLSAGSTTGDAELKDIRVGANGVTYNNAGDAVRGQYSKLNNYLKGNNIIETSKLTYGFVKSSDGTIYSGGSTYKYSELIPVNEGDIFLYQGHGSDGVLIIGAYETETGDAIVSKSVVGNGTNMKQSYVVPSGIKYIRMTNKVYDDGPLLIFLKNDKYVRGIKGGDFNDFTPSSTPYIINFGYNYTNSPDSESGILYCYEDYSTNIIWQMFIPTKSKNLYLRRKINNTWENWSYELKEKEISILFVGNSLTQDGIAYLPYLLKTYYPEVKFRFYMLYNGGMTLGEQYEYFINDTVCDIFSSCENSVSWTNYNSEKKMSEILSTYTFDVVCMQEYFNYKTSYTESDLIDWNNCKEYITSHYTGRNPLEFISLFHAPKRSDATTIFNRTVEGNNLILQKTIAQDMIANGIAVYRALSTELVNLGDQGNLSNDGTHTQDGLPCLLQTYVTACWLLDKLGIEKSVYGCPMRMTTDIYNTLNVPGANIGTGIVTGTDAQNMLAQEVAIKAYKEGKYYVNNNIFKIN